MAGRPLAVRLATLLAGVVVIVLILAGIVVNQAASRSLDETLSGRDQQRLGLAVAFVEEALQRGIDGRGLDMLVRRIAGESGGTIRVRAADGTLLATEGRQHRGAPTETLSTDLSAAAGGGTLEITVPTVRGGFIAAFNTALMLTGIVTVAALLVAATVLASRLTRPLRAVASAARRLGDGDLTTRATGGPDAESAELADAFNAMAGRLERSEGLRRRAASDLAHDLATPATVLESQLQAMVDGIVPANAAQLEKARAAAAGLSGLIVQLGELTHAEAAPLQREPQRIALRVLSGEIIGALDGLLRDRGVTARIEGREIHATADPGHVTRALRNLLTNAIQHSPAGGAVRIALARGATAEVRITDDGQGIGTDDLPYVFERFYRADRSRGRSAGSGIGLTVARELIGANGGSVEVEATGPGGTTFLVRLPSAEPA
ncbi:MAG: HAMP domain-containing sensor histidine kinase [Candidatus Limnocylindria bacterium]